MTDATHRAHPDMAAYVRTARARAEARRKRLEARRARVWAGAGLLSIIEREGMAL